MLTDCEKCWEHLCHCGYQYRNMTRHDRVLFAAAILGVPKHSVIETLGGIIPAEHPQKDSGIEK